MVPGHWVHPYGHRSGATNQHLRWIFGCRNVIYCDMSWGPTLPSLRMVTLLVMEEMAMKTVIRRWADDNKPMGGRSFHGAGVGVWGSNGSGR